MENSENVSPLKKYRRQPKLFIDIPSGGKYTPANTFYNDTTSQLAVFSMTANDEILFKTPDALVSGSATVQNIQSCIPSITNPWNLVTLDIDSVLIAIRMATYGPTMNVNSKCPKCRVENTYEIDLQSFLQHYQTCTYNDTLQVENFTIKTRPITYREMTENQKQTVAFQRAINIDVPKIKDDKERETATENLLNQIANQAVKLIYASISSVEVDGEIETNPKEIEEWVEGNDVSIFKAIKNHIEANSRTWQIPLKDVQCGECEHKFKINVSLDQSDFFGKG